MHDFQRDEQWATSQNPGLRLTGDSSFHECLGCHFIHAAFLFSVEVGKLFPCMFIFILLFQNLLQQGSWYSPIIFTVKCVSQTAGLLQWLRSELDIFSCCPSSQCRA